MKLSAGLSQLILEELSQGGLEIKPFSTDPTGAKGYNCSAFNRAENESENVELTINGETGKFRPTINVNVNFHRVKAALPAGAKMNTLTTASLNRVAAMVETLKK
jgi:hypothetical protein